ncbi:hypothetical protein SAMN05216241_105177 [Limimonas halophila]|uniref:DUF454 domain-containing protein n=1 Tax=Limimonas halophila TaxID=1082479 RepID=A0A1G7RL12_9PROT|nr:YbaN family protein [Limimonas halophila]SDG11456.1 hypothetical protein SAMN05216241_105177 [Limimonas halophila]
MPAGVSDVGSDPGNGHDGPPTAGRLTRWLWLGFGHGCVALGTAGAALPLLPTVPFLLLAAWAYARGSRRLRERLFAHPRFGPSLRAWRDHGVISRRGKIAAVAACGVSIAIAVASADGVVVPAVAGTAIAGAATFVVTRPSHAAESGRRHG